VVGFELGSYDTRRDLVIDPVLEYSTYVGGAGFDAAYAVVTDSTGNSYITGETASFDFPLTGTYAGVRSTRAAFVTKLSANGSQVLFTAILASKGTDSGRGIAIDGSGNLWFAGTTTGASLPVTSDAVRSTSNGGQDAFVARLDAAGQLTYATYLGGSGLDAATGIAVDPAGSVYVTGYTGSYNFPATPGAPSGSLQGAYDAFLTKLTSAGSIAYSTLAGGGGTDIAAGVAVDANGNACIAGSTNSPALSLQNAVQSSYGGNGDILLGCLNSYGTAWNVLTYLGGSGPDAANGIALDSSGDIYLTGSTYSPNFPVTSGAYQKNGGGDYDAFVVKLKAGGTAVVFATLLGGAGSDSGTAVAVDSSNRAWIAGYTASAGLPVTDASTFRGYFDCFVAEFRSDGSALETAGYLGGVSDDRCFGMALASTGAPILTGYSGSTDFPTTSGAAQTTASAAYNVFVARVKVVAAPPQAVSVSPSSGTGSSGTFGFLFSDSAGASDVAMIQILINGTFSGASACYVTLFPAGGSLYLYNDAATTLVGPVTAGTAGTVQNSQCTLNGAGTSVVLSGNTMTVNLAVSFPAGFAGAKNVYGYAQGKAGLGSGWQTLGAWTVPAPAPQAFSVTPSSGAGNSGTFSFLFSDSAGASDLAMVQMLVNGTFSGAPACYVTLFPAARSLYLFNDTGTALAGPVTAGAAGLISNGQCTVNGAGSTVAFSGNTLTVNLAVSFPADFAGAKTVYGYAQTKAGQGSGWQSLGAWTVLATAPQTVSVTPSSGTGSSGTFTFSFSDSNGASDLAMVQMLINGTFTGAPACYITLFAAGRSLYLYNDAATALIGPVTAGTAGTVQNSQCTVSGAGSSVISSGNTLTVNLAVSFPSGFKGPKNIYGYAQTRAGLGSGWRSLGTWTVPGTPPQAVSVSPSSGAGSSEAFTFSFSDASGASALGMVQMLINGTFSGASACYITLFVAGQSLYLYNDAATALVGPVTAGTAGTVQNSQCTVNGLGSSVTTSGDTLSVQLAVSFPSGFVGAKNVYGYAQTTAGLGSGWQLLGTWTVQ
jgi:hypothetical protein